MFNLSRMPAVAMLHAQRNGWERRLDPLARANGPAIAEWIEGQRREWPHARLNAALELLRNAPVRGQRGHANVSERLRLLERHEREEREHNARRIANRLREIADADPRYFVAIHEAGHAVAAVVLNAPGFVSASIEPDAGTNTLGRVLFSDVELPPPLTDAIIAVAGGVAEAKYNGETGFALSKSDLHLFNKACDRAGKERDTVRFGAKGEAVALINRHWSAVDALARELVVEKRLIADQVRNIVARHRA